MNWVITDSEAWLECSPGSGQNSGIITVTVDPTGIPTGSHSATIAVSDLGATNSPQYIDVTLNVYTSGSAKAPFGSYATPMDGSKVRSSIAVTGWVLDDIGIESVRIYREGGASLVYIGDAVLVEGARPDVEALYPDYPGNYKAGWGYMMLTNFLPNDGNGVYIIHAIATDREGRKVSLGFKTITCDNANAVKPFGAIDTPSQGGSASDSNFVNWGWALTPLPNSISTNGSTIQVWVDGANIGNPTYNVYRTDIASLFPGYANSNGAAGYFIFDTTPYTNGVHTIQWTVQDNAGNIDGIGSRYFTITNTGETSRSNVQSEERIGLPSKIQHSTLLDKNVELCDIPVNYSEPIHFRKGFRENGRLQEIYPDDSGVLNIKIRELERVEIHLGHSNLIGFQVIGDQLRALPIGSTLDIERGIFYWQPGVGFFEDYELVFVITREINRRKIKIRVKILPKHQKLLE